MVRFSTKNALFQDLKAGNRRLDILEARQWHDLLGTSEGDTLSVSLNGQSIGSHLNPGIAHSTNRLLRLLRLAVPRNAVVDNVKIYQKK